MIRWTFALALGVALSISMPAGAAEEQPLGSYQENWEGLIGVRTAFVTDPGFDPYASDNALTQFSIGGGRTLFARGPFSIAAIGFWDYGIRRSTARGEPTQLEVHRLSAGPELRYHLLPVLYGFVRPSPAALRTIAKVEDTVAGTSYYSRSWLFGWDVTAGAAFEVFGRRSGESRQPRFWLVGEGGYGWAASTEVRPVPDAGDSAAPQRVAALDLPALALRGAMFRISAMATF